MHFTVYFSIWYYCNWYCIFSRHFTSSNSMHFSTKNHQQFPIKWLYKGESNWNYSTVHQFQWIFKHAIYNKNRTTCWQWWVKCFVWNNLCKTNFNKSSVCNKTFIQLKFGNFIKRFCRCFYLLVSIMLKCLLHLGFHRAVESFAMF